MAVLRTFDLPGNHDDLALTPVATGAILCLGKHLFLCACAGLGWMGLVYRSFVGWVDNAGLGFCLKKEVSSAKHFLHSDN